MHGQPGWAYYVPPTREAVASDLQGLRQTTIATGPEALRHRYALLNLPYLTGVNDLEQRLHVLADSLRSAIAHPRLNLAQRLIASIVFFPSEEQAQLFLRERRELASQEIHRQLPPGPGQTRGLSVKQIEDREARVVAMLADLLLDRAFGRRVVVEHGLAETVAPPDDPYQGKGYEWVESTHELHFDARDPCRQRLRYTILLRALRRDQRLFQIRHDPVLPGEELPVVMLSGGEGHCFVGRVPDGRPNQPRAHLLYFDLGRTLQLGKTTQLAFEREFLQESAEQPGFGMGMDGTRQERLVLEAVLPPVMRCAGWAREEWSDGRPTADLVRSERFDVHDGESIHARFDVPQPERWHHFQIVWWRRGDPRARDGVTPGAPASGSD